MKPTITLRDLFWLTLVVACLCGWWLDRRGLLASNSLLEATKARYKTTVQTIIGLANGSGWSIAVDPETGEFQGAAHP